MSTESFAGVFQAVVNAIVEWVGRLVGELTRLSTWAYGVVFAVVISPVTMLLDFLGVQFDYLEAGMDSLEAAIDNLGVEQISSTWGSVAGWVGRANDWVPVSMAITVFSGLMGLWGVCFMIRLVLKIKAIFWAG